MKWLQPVVLFSSWVLLILLCGSTAYGQIHPGVNDCSVCHYSGTPGSTEASDCTDSANLKMVREEIETPNSGPKTVVFLSRPEDFVHGAPDYEGICEVCHTETQFHDNDGDGTDHFNDSDCMTCHPHSSADETILFSFLPDSGPESHDTHVNEDRGPWLDCLDCHLSHSDYTVFADNENLNNTNVCDNCHSSGGTFGGVAVAKAKWDDGVYDVNGMLKAGAEDWCLSCHDDVPANSQQDGLGISAPDKGENYYATGHGNSGSFNATLHGQKGPGYTCTVCHDSTSSHISGALGDAARLETADDGLDYTIDSSEVCLDCHKADQSENGSLGYDATAEASVHSGGVTGNYDTSSASAFPAYGDSADYGANPGYQCQECHEVHGTEKVAMVLVTLDGNVGGTSNPVSVAGFESTDTDLTDLDPSATVDDGVCDVCHTSLGSAHPDTNHAGNHNQGNTGNSCMGPACHSHAASFAHGRGEGCEECHGHDAGYGGATGGKGTYMSHSTHTENDSDDLMGPDITCADCHDTNAYPSFNDGQDLANTTICDDCHSQGGSYDGLAMAKGNWEDAVYEADGTTLQSGKDLWCATCHDEEPAEIYDVSAPMVIGDENAATRYGTGYGFYRTGHGLVASERYPTTGAPGAGLGCLDCHDAGMMHTDGLARTYLPDSDYATYHPVSLDYQEGYRLKDVSTGYDSRYPMHIPRTGHVDTPPAPFEPGFREDWEFALCFQCHDRDALFGPVGDPNTKTSFVHRHIPVEDFQTGDLTEFSWTTGGDASWDVVIHGYDGNYVAKAPELTGAQTSYLEVTMDKQGWGGISFRYKVSGAESSDALTFKIDDVVQDTWVGGGSGEWVEAAYPVTQAEPWTPTSHTYRWEFAKGSTATGYEVCIDDITFPDDEAWNNHDIHTDGRNGPGIYEGEITDCDTIRGSGTGGETNPQYDSDFDWIRIIMDNPEASYVGTWPAYGGYPGEDWRGYERYLDDFQDNGAGTGADKATWTPFIPRPDYYKVYAWWVAAGDPDHATDAPYTIHYDGGSQTIDVNQQDNGFQWNLLGTFPFAAGTSGSIVLSDDADGVVVADAIRLDRDVTPEDSRISCPACHNVHGSPLPAMFRHGELMSSPETTDKAPGLDYRHFQWGPTVNPARPGSSGGGASRFWGYCQRYVGCNDEGIGSGDVERNGVCNMCHNEYWFGPDFPWNTTRPQGGCDSYFTREPMPLSADKDSDPPGLSDQVPADLATDVPRNRSVTFVLSDTGTGIDWTTFQIQLTGTGYSKTYTDGDYPIVSKEGNPLRYTVTVDPDEDFPENDTITVTVDVDDLKGQSLTGGTWSFDTGDHWVVQISPSGLDPSGESCSYCTDPENTEWDCYTVGGDWADVLDSHDGDGSFVYASRWGPFSHYFNLFMDDPDPDQFTGRTIDSVTIRVYARYLAGRWPGAVPDRKRWAVGYRTGTSWKTDDWMWLPAAFPDADDHNYYLWTKTYTTDSDDGALDLTDINDLQIKISRRDGGTHQLRVTQVCAEVSLSPSP
ncbi:MAG: Ig-like domain-containing protein [Thermodesulfobacteriota bacterium]|nr:Ig-like domain-containing protein [Thermodesulfobacteriota bacterium]